jgi:hypothetical protein
VQNEIGALTPEEIELVRKARGRANEQALEASRLKEIMGKQAWAITPEDRAFLRDQIDQAVASGDVRF